MRPLVQPLLCLLSAAGAVCLCRLSKRTGGACAGCQPLRGSPPPLVGPRCSCLNCRLQAKRQGLLRPLFNRCNVAVAGCMLQLRLCRCLPAAQLLPARLLRRGTDPLSDGLLQGGSKLRQRAASGRLLQGLRHGRLPLRQADLRCPRLGMQSQLSCAVAGRLDISSAGPSRQLLQGACGTVPPQLQRPLRSRHVGMQSKLLGSRRAGGKRLSAEGRRLHRRLQRSRSSIVALCSALLSAPEHCCIHAQRCSGGHSLLALRQRAALHSQLHCTLCRCHSCCKGGCRLLGSRRQVSIPPGGRCSRLVALCPAPRCRSLHRFCCLLGAQLQGSQQSGRLGPSACCLQLCCRLLRTLQVACICSSTQLRQQGQLHAVPCQQLGGPPPAGAAPPRSLDGGGSSHLALPAGAVQESAPCARDAPCGREGAGGVVNRCGNAASHAPRCVSPPRQALTRRQVLHCKLQLRPLQARLLLRTPPPPLGGRRLVALQQLRQLAALGLRGNRTRCSACELASLIGSTCRLDIQRQGRPTHLRLALGGVAVGQAGGLWRRRRNLPAAAVWQGAAA